MGQQTKITAIRYGLTGGLFVFALTPWCSSPLALALGLGVGFAGLTVMADRVRRWSKLLLAWSVVVLGFAVPLREVLATGVAGLAVSAATISVTFGLGYAVARVLGIGHRVTTLVSGGTAICGGSAIAAIGSATSARHSEMAGALGAVFVLNAIALYLFPAIGHTMGLSAEQFGAWAGMAIHDMSSVVGAASYYDTLVADNTSDDAALVSAAALETATAVKLARTLWIAPLAVIAAVVYQRSQTRGDEPGSDTQRKGLARVRVPIPWFIALFLVAAALSYSVDAVASQADVFKAIAKGGMRGALFLIGAGLSIATLREVGWRPMVLAVVLWVVISVGSLFVALRVLAMSPTA